VISPRSTERKIEVITAPAVIIKRDLVARSPLPQHHPVSSPPKHVNVAKVNMAFSGIPSNDKSLENPFAKIDAIARIKK
jgi:hypothetical protein